MNNFRRFLVNAVSELVLAITVFLPLFSFGQPNSKTIDSVKFQSISTIYNMLNERDDIGEFISQHCPEKLTQFAVGIAGQTKAKFVNEISAYQSVLKDLTREQQAYLHSNYQKAKFQIDTDIESYCDKLLLYYENKYINTPSNNRYDILSIIRINAERDILTDQHFFYNVHSGSLYRGFNSVSFSLELPVEFVQAPSGNKNKFIYQSEEENGRLALRMYILPSKLNDQELRELLDSNTDVYRIENIEGKYDKFYAYLGSNKSNTKIDGINCSIYSTTSIVDKGDLKVFFYMTYYTKVGDEIGIHSTGTIDQLLRLILLTSKFETNSLTRE